MSEPTESLTILLPQIRSLIQSARNTAARTVNTLQVLTNFEIGRLIVENQQQGAERADYGKELVKKLAQSLTAEFGRGFSKPNLEYMRRFYLLYSGRVSGIAQTPSGQLECPPIFPSPSGKSQPGAIAQTLSGKSQADARPFVLSWSHYVLLIGIENPAERAFYEIEAETSGWSVRELRRHFDSSLYERIALSREPERLAGLATHGDQPASPRDLLKNPCVLEFLGLDEKAAYSDSDLESAIIDKLEHFLLELGKGFLFEARQKRFTFEDDHFFVDLVFYNRLLRCYVLIDLKIGKLTHQDLGQMQMYVNDFDRHVKLPEEHPTVGIILCKKKNDALVEITLPENASIYASEYKLYLPSKEELRQQLLDWETESPP